MSDSDENKRLVFHAFQPWEQGNSTPFFDLIADDVTWTVIGSTSVSGVYHSKQEVIDRAFDPLLRRLNGGLTADLSTSALMVKKCTSVSRAAALPRLGSTTSRHIASRW
jgi:ketosteroid isomerase-like protein